MPSNTLATTTMMTTINDLPFDYRSFASFNLYSLSSESQLWLHLSLSTFPSLRHPRILPSLSSSPHLFFDAFLLPDPFAGEGSATSGNAPDELISAVDIHNRGAHIFSLVMETDTSSSWFRGSPFLIHAMDPKTEPIIISPEEMTLSWILIDPTSGRGVNVSSRRAVWIERNGSTGKTIVRFVLVGAKAEMAIGVVVTCEEVTGKVCEMVMTAEDVDGGCLSGEKAISVLWGMMREQKGRWGVEEEEEVKGNYLEYWRRKEISATTKRLGDLGQSDTSIFDAPSDGELFKPLRLTGLLSPNKILPVKSETVKARNERHKFVVQLFGFLFSMVYVIFIVIILYCLKRK